MNAINLIPRARMEARRRRARWVRCFAVCGAYAVLLLGLCALSRLAYVKVDPTVKEKLVESATEVERAGKAIVAVKEQLALADATLRASRSISEQPDWSALMALLAAKAGDEIVLKTCLVRPKDPDRQVDTRSQGPGALEGGARVAQAPAAEPSMVLGLSGLGLSQGAVSQFVLKLEATRLFAKVALIDTSRAALERTDAIAFRLECSLDEPVDSGPTIPVQPPIAPPVAAKEGRETAPTSPAAAVDPGEAAGGANSTSNGGVQR